MSKEEKKEMMPVPVENRNKGGRPSKYKTAYNEQARKLCLLGATDKELAAFFEVTEVTITEWKKKYPKFYESLRNGKTEADAVVAEKLFKRATGYAHDDIDIRVVRGKIRKIKIIKQYPPDTVAAIFWLKNRQKDNWRDKHHIGFDYDKLTDDQLEKIIDDLRKTANNGYQEK